MKDIFGKELSLGDTVAFNPPYSKGLIIGTIAKFTPKQVKIEYYGSTWREQSVLMSKLDYPENVVKKD
jgi:hypothetical protein